MAIEVPQGLIATLNLRHVTGDESFTLPAPIGRKRRCGARALVRRQEAVGSARFTTETPRAGAPRSARSSKGTESGGSLKDVLSRDPESLGQSSAGTPLVSSCQLFRQAFPSRLAGRVERSPREAANAHRDPALHAGCAQEPRSRSSRDANGNSQEASTDQAAPRCRRDMSRGDRLHVQSSASAMVSSHASS